MGTTLDLGPFWNHLSKARSSLGFQLEIFLNPVSISAPIGKSLFSNLWTLPAIQFLLLRRKFRGILKRGQEKWQSWQISAFADKKDHRVCQYLLLIGGESLRTNGQTRPYWFSISTSQPSMKPVNKIWNKSSLTNQLLVRCRKRDTSAERKGQAQSCRRIDREIRMNLGFAERLQQFWLHFLSSSGWPDTLKAGYCRMLSTDM